MSTLFYALLAAFAMYLIYLSGGYTPPHGTVDDEEVGQEEKQTKGERAKLLNELGSQKGHWE